MKPTDRSSGSPPPAGWEFERSVVVGVGVGVGVGVDVDAIGGDSVAPSLWTLRAGGVVQPPFSYRSAPSNSRSGSSDRSVPRWPGAVAIRRSSPSRGPSSASSASRRAPSGGRDGHLPVPADASLLAV